MPPPMRNVGEIRRTVVNDFVNRHVDVMMEQAAQEQELQLQQQQQISYNPPKPLTSQRQVLEKIGEVSGEDDQSYSTADASTSASSVESFGDDTSGGGTSRGNCSSAAAVRISQLKKLHSAKLRPAEHRVHVMNDMSSVSSYELDESMSMDLSSKGTGFSEWDNDSLGNVLSAGPQPSAAARAAIMRRSGSPGSVGVEAPPKPMPAVSPAAAKAIGPPVNPRNRHAELALRIQEALKKFDQVSDRVRGNMDTTTSTNSPMSSQRPTVQVASLHSLDAKEAAASHVGASRSSAHHPQKQQQHRDSKAAGGGHRSQRRNSVSVPHQDHFTTSAHRSMAAVGPDVRTSAAAAAAHQLHDYSSNSYDYDSHHRSHNNSSSHHQQSRKDAASDHLETSSSATHSSSCTMDRFDRRYSDFDDDDTVKAKVEDDESEVAWRWPVFLCCFVCLMIVIVVLVASIVAVTVVEVGKHKSKSSAASSTTGPFSVPEQPPVMIPVQQPVLAPVDTPVQAPVEEPTAAAAPPVESPTAVAPKPALAAPVQAPVQRPVATPIAAAAPTTALNGTEDLNKTSSTALNGTDTFNKTNSSALNGTDTLNKTDLTALNGTASFNKTNSTALNGTGTVNNTFSTVLNVTGTFNNTNNSISTNITFPATAPVRSPVLAPTRANESVPTVLAPSLIAATPNLTESATFNRTNTTTGTNHSPFTVTLTNSSFSLVNETEKNSSSTTKGTSPSGGRRRYRRVKL